jgi:hypothetical protein
MWDYLITKNPIDKELQVHIVSRSSSVGDSGDLPTEPIDNSEINISFKLLDNTGVTHRRTNHRRRKNRETTSVEFDVSNLREGTYYLHIESDGQIIKEQIIVTR